MSSLDTPILVCDDEVHLVQLLCEFLEEYGHKAIGVYRGREVLEKVRTENVDVVLLDISLPDVNGLEVLRQLKEEERKLGRVIRVIILTAHQDPKLALEAMTRGAYFFFNKPIVFKNVIEQIQIAVDEIVQEREKLSSLAEQGVSEPADALDQLMAAKEQPQLAAVRFAFNRLAVLQNAPENPGVVTLRDKDEKAIYVEWVDNIARRLTYFIALNPALSEQCRYARTFEYFLTEDKSLAGTIFDKLVNELGAFPKTMKEAPQGSKYFGKDESAVGGSSDKAVTQMVHATETKALQDVKRMLDESPDDPNLMDWYAFLCYSHGQLDESIELYEKLLERGSKKLEHHFYLANARYKKGDVKGAITHWRTVVQKAPGKKLGKKSALRIKNAVAELGGQSQ